MTEDTRRSAFPAAIETRIHAAYFFEFHDQEFIEEVYRKLLFREPDPSGFDTFISFIRSGESRYKVLRAISQSSEAREKGVTVDGMEGYEIIRLLEKIPVIGSLMELFSFVWHIKAFRKDIRALENHIYRISQRNSQ